MPGRADIWEDTMTAAQKFTESYFPKQETGSLIDMTLGDLMRKNAAEVPDRIALVEGVKDPATLRTSGGTS